MNRRLRATSSRNSGNASIARWTDLDTDAARAEHAEEERRVAVTTSEVPSR